MTPLQQLTVQVVVLITAGLAGWAAMRVAVWIAGWPLRRSNADHWTERARLAFPVWQVIGSVPIIAAIVSILLSAPLGAATGDGLASAAAARNETGAAARKSSDEDWICSVITWVRPLNCAMKKRILIGLSLLLVCLLVVWYLPRRGTAHTVTTAFLGFTNSGGRVEAIFALSNPPPVSVTLHSVRRISMLTNNGATPEAGYFSWARREPWGLPYAIGVDSTNEPLQVVFQFQERAVGPRRVVEQLRELWGRLSGNDREFFTGSIFFVTNRTDPAILRR